MTAHRDERGAVAILVLWAMAIVFMLLAAAGFTLRADRAIARNELAGARASEAAGAGAELGLSRLLAHHTRGDAVYDGTPEPWQDGTTRVSIAIADEAGKIDLNTAPLGMIAGLFAAAGTPREEAFLIACRIGARRGGDMAGCPEPDDAAPERTALFAVPEEIAALPGVDDRLYQRVACCITTATGASAIDPAVAPRLALLALPGATPSLVDGWIAARADLMKMAPETVGFEALPDADFLTLSPARDFTVSAVATTPEGARARVALQVRLTGIPSHPYDIVAFRAAAP